MKTFMSVLWVLVTACGLQPCIAKAQVTVGQVDTFEDGTTQGWFAGGGPVGAPHPAPPMNVPDGGPAGAGDNFLSLTAFGGAGPASRLAAANTAQWAGDYLSAGVTGIVMDLNNLGAADLFLRIAIADPTAVPPANIAFSTNPVFLPAGSGWTSALFPLGLGDLTAGMGSVNAALMNATELRLYHSPDPNFPNPFFPIPAVAASLHVDNITAIPEPSSAVLVGTLLLMVCPRRIRAASRLN